MCKSCGATLTNISDSQKHMRIHFGVHKLFLLIPPGQQPQITCRRSRSFLQRLRYYTHSSQLPALITTHTIKPLNLPTFSTQSATFLNLLWKKNTLNNGMPLFNKLPRKLSFCSWKMRF